MSTRLRLTQLLFCAGLFAAGLSQAAELRVLSAIAMQSVMHELGPQFETQSGHRLNISFATMGGVVKSLQDGEAADLVLIPRPGIDQLIKAEKLLTSEAKTIARSGIGLAVGPGQSKPDIATPAALKAVLLSAKSLTYSAPAHGGATGRHIEKIFEQLGIAQEMKAKTVFLPKAGLVATLVASGEVQVAIQQVQELIQVPGVQLVGAWPAELQDTIVFVAAPVAGSPQPDAAKALIDFLGTPAAKAAMQAKGMEPN